MMVTCVHMSILTLTAHLPQKWTVSAFSKRSLVAAITHTRLAVGGAACIVVAAVSYVRVRRVGGRRAAGDALCCAAAVARMLQLR